MIDIVMPSGNEEGFIKMAEELSYDGLILLKSQRIGELQKTAGIKLYSGSEIKIYKSIQDDRAAFEKKALDLVYDLEYSGRQDFIHQKNSGLNQVLCEIARRRDVLICFSFSSLLESRYRSQAIGRIKQNIRLCRKFRLKTAVASFAQSPIEMRSPKDLAALFTVLGMHPKEAKESLNAVAERIKRNIRKKSPDYIAEGIEQAK